MEIDVVHRYSHLGEKLSHITYNAISIKLTGILQVLNSCTKSKEKMCGHTWSILGDLNWEYELDICSRQLQPLFLEFLHENQVTTSKEYGRVFREDDVMWEAS